MSVPAKSYFFYASTDQHSYYARKLPESNVSYKLTLYSSCDFYVVNNVHFVKVRPSNKKNVFLKAWWWRKWLFVTSEFDTYCYCRSIFTRILSFFVNHTLLSLYPVKVLVRPSHNLLSNITWFAYYTKYSDAHGPALDFIIFLITDNWWWMQ